MAHVTSTSSTTSPRSRSIRPTTATHCRSSSLLRSTRLYGKARRQQHARGRARPRRVRRSAPAPTSRARPPPRTVPFVEILSTLWSYPKPVVHARLNGHVHAGGFGLVAAADVVIAPTSASFAFSEVRIGVAPAVIAVLCQRRMTPRAAGRYLLTGEVFDALTPLARPDSSVSSSSPTGSNRPRRPRSCMRCARPSRAQWRRRSASSSTCLR